MFYELSLPIQVGFASIICIVAFKIYILTTTGRCLSQTKLHGKTVIITGANTGIGKETAIDLATRGAKVILACRNFQKAKLAQGDIIEASRNDNVIVRELDLTSLSSVRKFAAAILESETRLDILINNAGCAGQGGRKMTEDDLEYTMQSNYFGHYLLTNLLLGLLKKSSPSRVVNVSSFAHTYANKLDFTNLNSENRYDSIQTYHTSKLCQILFCHYLAPIIIKSGVTVNSLHPGIVRTDIFRPSFRLTIMKYLVLPFFKSAEEGAQTSIYLAVADEVADVTGKYFSDCKICEPSKPAKDDATAKKLWEISNIFVKLNQEEWHL